MLIEIFLSINQVNTLEKLDHNVKGQYHDIQYNKDNR